MRPDDEVICCIYCGKELAPQPKKHLSLPCKECRQKILSTTLTTEQKEQIIDRWPFPFDPMADFGRQERDDRLKHAQDDEEREKIIQRYVDSLDRMISRSLWPGVED